MATQNIPPEDRVSGWFYVEGANKLHYFEDGYCICHTLKAFREYELSPVGGANIDKCWFCKLKTGEVGKTTQHIPEEAKILAGVAIDAYIKAMTRDLLSVHPGGIRIDDQGAVAAAIARYMDKRAWTVDVDGEKQPVYRITEEPREAEDGKD